MQDHDAAIIANTTLEPAAMAQVMVSDKALYGKAITFTGQGYTGVRTQPQGELPTKNFKQADMAGDLARNGNLVVQLYAAADVDSTQRLSTAQVADLSLVEQLGARVAFAPDGDLHV